MRHITVLGATGSIGLNTLDVIRHNSDDYRVFALTANTQVEKLYHLCIEFNPEFAVLLSGIEAQRLEKKLKLAQCKTQVLYGEDALIDVSKASRVDVVMAAIVGAAGLKPCLAAAQAGKQILLANKESLVMAGELFLNEVKSNHASLLPVDSEHNAIFQSLPFEYQANYLNNNIEAFGVRSIILTGSGGPFRTTPLNDLIHKTPDEACAHPNWDMGRKISVDSATMMNKGLEFIEACYLFGVQPDFIEVLLHPQSVIHSMVRYNDGSVLAQMGQPDMRTPIAHTMAFPQRIVSGVEPYDFVSGGSFSFESPEKSRFPNLYLAKNAFKLGQEITTVLNAANEENVALFLDHKITFTDIAIRNEKAVSALAPSKAHSIDDILAIDDEARQFVLNLPLTERGC